MKYVKIVARFLKWHHQRGTNAYDFLRKGAKQVDGLSIICPQVTVMHDLVGNIGSRCIADIRTLDTPDTALAPDIGNRAGCLQLQQSGLDKL